MPKIVGYALTTTKSEDGFFYNSEQEDGIGGWSNYNVDLFRTREEAEAKRNFYRGEWCSDRIHRVNTDDVTVKALWVD